MTTTRYILILTLIFNCLSAGHSWANGISDQVVSDNVPSESEVKNNEERNNDNSREDKALDAQNQGELGAGLAAGVGAALLGTGIPMLVTGIVTGNIPLAVAGSDLIAKGGMEFAQSAENKEGASANSNQRAQLNGDAGQGSLQTTADALNDPQLNKVLADAGLNAENFKERLASGEFKNGTDVMKALGMPVDSNATSEGERLANEKMNFIFDSATKKQAELAANTITAKKDDDGKKQEESGSFGSPSGTKNSNSRELASSSLGESASSKNSLGLDKKTGLNSLDHTNEGDSKGGMDVNSLFTKMFGKGSEIDAEAQRSLVRQELGKMGIQLPIKGVSIFGLAHRQYGEFAKTRANRKRVATR